MTQHDKTLPQLIVVVNTGTLGERTWRGQEARVVLVPIIRSMIKDWPMGFQPRVITAGTTIKWSVPTVKWRSSLVSNADIRVTPNETGDYSRGAIDFLIDGRDCGCGASHQVDAYRSARSS
jgi:hypothetical protein